MFLKIALSALITCSLASFSLAGPPLQLKFTPSILVKSHPELNAKQIHEIEIEIAELAGKTETPEAKPAAKLPPLLPLPSFVSVKRIGVPKAGEVFAADDEITLAIDKKGIDFTDFVDAFAMITGARFTFDPRQTANHSVILRGKTTFKKKDVDMVFQSLLRSRDLALVPLGIPELNMFQIDNIRTSQVLKQTATQISLDELEAYRRHPARVVSTVFPLQHADCIEVQRALSNIIQEHRVGFTVPLPRQNSLIVTNFSPTVHEMWQLVQALDVKAAQPEHAPKPAGEEGK